MYHNIIIYPNKSKAHINAWAPKTRGSIQPSKVDYIKCRKYYHALPHRTLRYVISAMFDDYCKE